MFYWVRVHHWKLHDEEEFFDNTTIGWIHLQEYIHLRLASGWEVKEIRLMNDKRSDT